MEKNFKSVRILILSAVLLTLLMACNEEELPESPQPIKTGWWSTPSEDVQFYISQQTKLDTLRITFTLSGSCSGSIVSTTYPVSITDRAFTRDLGSSWEGTTGSIQGTFSMDGKSCSGTYEYNRSPCNPISESWTATPD